MNSTDIDVVIIGGGVVGLAVAAELTQRSGMLSVALLEQHGRFGQETSSRNSEVIHAGIYYPEHSLKARLCLEGKKLLYRFCEHQGVPHRRLGKLIIARNPEEAELLEPIVNHAKRNGVTDLQILDSSQVSAMEPHLKATAAIWSPSTGIIDSHQLMARLEYLAKQNGAWPAYRHKVIGLETLGSSFKVQLINPEGKPDSIRCRWLINCAGLNADQVAAWMGIDLDSAGYKIYPCKGEYYSLPYSKAGLVSRLIYPPPLKSSPGLGIHVTKTLDGRLRLGPNAIYVENIDYRVDPAHAPLFYQEAKCLLPFVELPDLEPEMAGIRPKLQRPGEPFRDFVVNHETERGLPGAINLIGIESPGLTSCLSLAQTVARFIL